VGGVTAGTGKGKRAVYNRGASPDGVIGGKGKAPAPPPPPPGPDLSRPAQQAPGNRLSQCPWPPEADIEQINFMRVNVVISMDANGKAMSANVPNDPGYGFGRAASRCAMRDPWVPPLDRAGKAQPGTISINLTFKR
jgi:protein TonB